MPGTLRVHWLQHVPFEGLGSIAPWLAARDARVSVTRLHERPGFPPLADFDVLIAMGGPMSVNDEAALPWLVAEKGFVRTAIEARKHVLGICLGAQLIASALGATVRPNGEREIGWHPLARVGDTQLAALAAPGGEAFHWHGETFDLPGGAVRLAGSEACAHQAFALGERVLALQFHLEMTAGGALAMIESCPADLAPGRWVQTPRAMLDEPARFARANAAMDALLARFLASA
jgi:GMP synthase-like glutamine amidotransferase